MRVVMSLRGERGFKWGFEAHYCMYGRDSGPPRRLAPVVGLFQPPPMLTRTLVIASLLVCGWSLLRAEEPPFIQPAVNSEPRVGSAAEPGISLTARSDATYVARSTNPTNEPDQPQPIPETPMWEVVALALCTVVIAALIFRFAYRTINQ